MVIECVTLETNHYFSGNPIAEQHRLRYKSIIKRQDWDIPEVREMEYDQYDNPSATYLVWRDDNKIARGISRLCPTDRPFMLQEHFSHLVTYQDIPQGPNVWEGSRFCIDKNMDLPLRKRIAKEIVLSYLEYGVEHGIEQIIGVMYPIYWHNLFTKNGWQPKWIGEPILTPDGKKSRAAILPLSQEVLLRVQKNTGINHKIVSYGELERYAAAI